MAGHDQMWPADKVERWPVDRLIPYARNARQHSEAQISQIAASIKGASLRGSRHRLTAVGHKRIAARVLFETAKKAPHGQKPRPASIRANR